MTLIELKPYWDKIKSLPIAELLRIAALYGKDAITELTGLPETGDGMTKSLYLSRMDKCSVCPLRTAHNTCDPAKTRLHVSEKNADGTPLQVNGCGCVLRAKQKSIKDHCPAGEW